jgi:hypothetical protein
LTTPKDIKRMNADRNYLIEQQEKKLNDLREETAPRKRVSIYELEPLTVSFRTTYADEPTDQEVYLALREKALKQLEDLVVAYHDNKKFYLRHIVEGEDNG